MHEKLAWIDTETTGLFSDETRLLQIALVITDGQANIITQAEHTIWQPESVLAQMRPFVRNMHTKNGLIEKVRMAREDEREVERRLMRLMVEHTAMNEVYMAGSSIAFDRYHIKRSMPALDSWMHYRLVDVSALKAMRQAMGLPRYESDGEVEHTALADIFASIKAYRYYAGKQLP